MQRGIRRWRCVHEKTASSSSRHHRDMPVCYSYINIYNRRQAVKPDSSDPGHSILDIDWINDTITVTQSKTGRALRIPLTADVGNAPAAYLIPPTVLENRWSDLPSGGAEPTSASSGSELSPRQYGFPKLRVRLSRVKIESTQRFNARPPSASTPFTRPCTYVYSRSDRDEPYPLHRRRPDRLVEGR